MKSLYPHIEPNRTFFHRVSKLHSLYVEEVGNPDGIPIVFLHGGPGGGISPQTRSFFDPKVFRIILFDQRGAGKSTPAASIIENTTWDLIKDIESIRSALQINSWHVFGGSWGSTLALAYAISHPSVVKSLVLRGIFLLRQKEISWFYQHGAREIFPEAFEAFLKPIPINEQGHLVEAYHRRLTSKEPLIAAEAAKAWSQWEASTSKLIPDLGLCKVFEDAQVALQFARIECHYFINKGFFGRDNYILENLEKIHQIPMYLVHGRYDVICPATSAYDLHSAHPKSKLAIVDNAGHSAFEPGITHELICATDAIADGRPF